MKIAVLGTGVVGRTIATKLVSLGHEVTMGSRSAGNEKASAWAKQSGKGAYHRDFARAAESGEIVFACTAGLGTLDALRMAGVLNLRSKVLIDISNALDLSNGFPPVLSFRGDDSLGESIRRAFPEVKVVKTLNTVNAEVMVSPARVPGDHDAFVSGNDIGAKAQVIRILHEWFGWKNLIDLGDITTARGTEAYVLFWLQLMRGLKTTDFNVQVPKQ
jgi:hypothetical protein